MNILPPEKLDRLQERTDCIRNLCVIAHVDHGKTSLVDCLISHNQIISEKRAGEEMYMDNTKTEQERLITMKSSSISLLYFDHTRRDPDKPKPYLMHLIDSPGHVDFSSEVSAAVRVSDGALLVIDVIEGVSVQTKTVLRQAWEERMELCLVLNKIDRLVLQKKFKALEAYEHIKNVLEQVNAVYASFAREDSFKQMEQKRAQTQTIEEEEEEEDGSLEGFKSMVISDAAVDMEDTNADEYFHPEKGNVIFASAKDKWGFRVHDFATVYAKKFKMSYNVLVKTLWGDFYLNKKEKKFYKKPQSASDVPLFVQFILRNIWRMYHITCVTPDKEKVEADAKVLGLNIPLRDLLRLREEPKLVLHALLGQWLPIAPAVLSMAARCLPSPIKSQKNRMASLWPSHLLPDGENSLSEEKKQELKKLYDGCENADLSAPLLAYVSKVLVYPKQSQASSYSSMKVALPGVRTTGVRPQAAAPSPSREEDTEQERYISFVRIFSGTLKKGDTIQVLAREYDPISDSNEDYIREVKAEELFLMMGRELGPLKRICAGNVFGLGGIANSFNKFATLSQSPVAPSLAPISVPVPLVRVALEPNNPRMVKELDRALYQLSRADSSVEIFNEKAGEIIIATAGELHLERCLDDLKDRYGISNVRVSNPIIPFKETITSDMAANKGVDDQIQESFTAAKTIKISVKAEPIPAPLLEFFSSEKYRSAIARDSTSEKAIKDLRTLLEQECIRLKLSEKWIERVKNIWSIEPAGVGDNFLIGELPASLGKIDLLELHEMKEGPKIEDLPKKEETPNKKKDVPAEESEEEKEEEGEKEFDWMEEIELRKLTHEELQEQLMKMKVGILNGFRHSINNGPLCGEPVTGVAVFVTDFEFYDSKQEQRGYGTFSGQVMSAMSQGCRQALLVRSMRIVEPVYGCFLEVAQEVLGQATGLIRKRRGQILSDTMKEGTNWFEIDAEIPVVESFGLCKDLRNWGSGSVTVPSLLMKGWRQLEDDPFYIPRSEEDKEEWGDNFKFMTNRAREIMNEVRKRKGLFIEKQLVESANKQRTLSKKK